MQLNISLASQSRLIYWYYMLRTHQDHQNSVENQSLNAQPQYRCTEGVG